MHAVLLLSGDGLGGVGGEGAGRGVLCEDL